MERRYAQFAKRKGKETIIGSSNSTTQTRYGINWHYIMVSHIIKFMTLQIVWGGGANRSPHGGLFSAIFLGYMEMEEKTYF